MTGVSVASKSQEENVTQKPQYICKSCNSQCSEDDDAIQCQECKFWMHYRCTNLPEYQLYLYECTQRKFTCKFCVDIDAEFSESFKASQNSPDSKALLTEKINVEGQNQTDRLKHTCTPDATRARQAEDLNYDYIAEVSKQIDNHFGSTKERKSSSCQTDTNFQLVDLQELNKSTVSSLQESFVGAFDRINQSVRSLKTNIEEENNLNQKINALTKENERLKARISEDALQGNKRKCHNFDEFSQRVEKLTKSLDKEKENEQLKLHDITLQKELQESKMKADASLLHHKIEIINKQFSMQENEVTNLEKRIDTKNILICTLEEKTGEMTKKIADLQDEVLSLKLHNCTAASQQQLMTKENDTARTNQKDDSQASTGKEVSKSAERQYSEIVKETNHRQEEMGSKTKDSMNNTSQSPKEETRKQSNIKKVQIVGTSNTKYVSLKYIAGTEFNISKKIKYTFEETKDYFENLEQSEHQDAFILQSLCNEITKKSRDECSRELTNIIDTIESKCKNTRVIVSLGLPRDDVTLNRKVEKINILLKENLTGQQNVQLCDNSNLFYRGAAQHGILKEDGLHLSKDGTKLLAKNIRESLYDVFDFPIITYDSRENGVAHSPTKIDTGYDGIKYGQGKNFKQDEKSDYQWRDDRRREYAYMGNRRYDDTYQRYERDDDQYYFRGYDKSPRSPRDRDSNDSGHHRRPYAPYYQQRRY